MSLPEGATTPTCTGTYTAYTAFGGATAAAAQASCAATMTTLNAANLAIDFTNLAREAAGQPDLPYPVRSVPVLCNTNNCNAPPSSGAVGTSVAVATFVVRAPPAAAGHAALRGASCAVLCGHEPALPPHSGHCNLPARIVIMMPLPLVTHGNS